MKSRLFKRILAMGLMVMLVSGEVTPVIAESDPVVTETVSGGDAVVEEEPTDTTETEVKEITENTDSDVNHDTDSFEATDDTDAEVEAEATVSGGDAEVNVSGGDAEETVSGGDLVEIVEEEVPLAENFMVTLEPVTVDGVTITVSGPKAAFEEGTTVSAVAVEPAEVVIETTAENEQATVVKYKAFDINLMLNGETVQPLNGEEIRVNFEGDMLIPNTDNNENVAVYHVDENDNVTKMEAEVAPMETEEKAEVETVEMTTTHFSVYVIAVLGEKFDQNVTFMHYLGTPESREMIYAPTEMTIKSGETFYKDELPLQGEGNYVMTQFVVTSDENAKNTYINNTESTERVEVELTGKENLVEIYYAALEPEVAPFKATFFDYYVDDVGASYSRVDIKQDDILTGFTIGSTSYNGNYRVGRLNNFCVLQDGWKTVTLTQGTVLEDVTGRRGSGWNATTETWENLIYTRQGNENGFYTQNSVTSSKKKDAGINGGADTSKPFLAMGVSQSGDDVNETHVSSNTGFGVTNKNNQVVNINDNNTDGSATSKGDQAIVSGLVTGLTDDLSNVVMGTAYPLRRNNTLDTDNGQQIQEPGYFTTEVSDNKAVLENYVLKFNVEGNTYTLDYVENTEEGANKGNRTYSWNQENGNRTLNKQFLPLDDADKIGGRTWFQPKSFNYYRDYYENDKTNYYFGMRYDFDFSLGDYIGPLTYEFQGDDDLWVFVDGKLVLDLGGMHSVYPGTYNKYDANSVDLWKAFFEIDTTADEWWAKEDYLALDKNQNHQVTILYMERGGYDSSCAMEFVIPNVNSKEPVASNVPKANLELVKKDTDTNGVIGEVGFTLYSDAECKNVIGSEKLTGLDGKVTFSELRAGNTYYLKETRWDSTKYEENANVYIVKVNYTEDGTEATASVEGLTQENGAYVVYNTPLKAATLEFYKVNRYTHEAIPGVTFYLKDADGNPVGEAVSGEKGYFKFENIKAGTYTLEEDSETVPDGYQKPASAWTIVVKEDMTYTEAGGDNGELWWFNYQGTGQNLIKNEPYVSFEFTKIDSETKDSIRGVEFVLYKELDTKSEVEATVTSDADGKVKFDNLSVNHSYLLVEKTPEGYIEAGPWVIRVETENAKMVQKLYNAKLEKASSTKWQIDGEAYENMVIENTPAKGSLMITKTVDEINMAYGTPTFTFQIEGPGGEVLYRTISFTDAGKTTESITINNLPVGEYKVTELDTLRYTLNEEKSSYSPAEVTENNTPEFEFYNELTSDDGYSHSDVIVNSFRKGTDGKIEISKEHSVVETAAANN